MVKPVVTINVVPDIPKKLARLQELAYNLRWSWDYETARLFARIDNDLWLSVGRNPVRMLGLVSQERLDAVQKDAAFMANYNRVLAAFDEYMGSKNTWFDKWYEKNYKNTPRPIFAYFSMEFGLTECLQNYSGGLGVLSGDHLKSASDLGIPLVGVGLLYQEGYFQQYLNADGYQQELYPINDFSTLPITLQRDGEGNPIKINVQLPGRQLYAQIWKVQVGRIALYLLDTNIDDNPRIEDRNLTDRLYGGDKRTRIRQEILMGIGGIRALDALGLRPTVCHMNEGHSAFLALERVRQLMTEHGLNFWQAKEIAKLSNVFTTHTPVPAGLERFGFDLIDEHFTDLMRQLGLTREQFIDLGREDMGTYQLFSMALLALHFSSSANGVAQLHGRVSREMWNYVYPDVPEKEVPIDAITNGVHMLTWVSGEMAGLFDRYLSPEWRTNESDPAIWEGVEHIPDGELWRTHERRRERLVAFTRQRLRQQLIKRGTPQSEIEMAEEVLNPDTLTIGFARRFATYKRATLIFEDLDRFSRIVNNTEYPVQFIFAGKAHPHDEPGKAFIREIVRIAHMPEFRHKIVFLENYDMLIARYLVQGVDVWLNNPRRPKEASGTSGMKVIYNGGLNFSILDGWWAEAYEKYGSSVGWAIGNGEEYDEEDWEHQDRIEAQALLNVLENDLIPTFYNRGRDSLPREWIGKIKQSMIHLAPFFTTRRMVQEYTEKYYMPLFDLTRKMKSPDDEVAKQYTEWRLSLSKLWTKIKVNSVTISSQEVKVDETIEVSATVNLGELTPDSVRVELYYGALNLRGEINDATSEAVEMKPNGKSEGSVYTFSAQIKANASGDRGISVRVLPKHELLTTPFQPNLITWA